MAVYNDGTPNSLARLGDNPTGNFTYCKWVKRDSSGGDDFQFLGGFGGYFGNGADFRSYFGTPLFFGNPLGNSTIGDWLFVAVTFDGTTTRPYTMQLGAGALTVEATYPTDPTISGGTAPGFSLFTFTESIDGIAGSQAFKGHLAGVKAWARALTPTELLTEAGYIRAVDTADIFFEYPLTTAAAAAIDATGNGHDLTLTGTLANGSIPDPVPLVPDTPVAISGTAAGGSSASIVLKAKWGGVLNPHYYTDLDGDVYYDLEGRPYWDADYRVPVPVRALAVIGAVPIAVARFASNGRASAAIAAVPHAAARFTR